MSELASDWVSEPMSHWVTEWYLFKPHVIYTKLQTVILKYIYNRRLITVAAFVPGKSSRQIYRSPFQDIGLGIQRPLQLGQGRDFEETADP